jgi:hypothetical protein
MKILHTICYQLRGKLRCNLIDISVEVSQKQVKHGNPNIGAPMATQIHHKWENCLFFKFDQLFGKLKSCCGFTKVHECFSTEYIELERTQRINNQNVTIKGLGEMEQTETRSTRYTKLIKHVYSSTLIISTFALTSESYRADSERLCGSSNILSSSLRRSSVWLNFRTS